MHTFKSIQGELALRRTQLAPLHAEMAHDENFINAPAVWNDRSMMQYFNGLDQDAQIRLLSIADDIVVTGLSQFIIGEHPSNKVVLPRDSHREEGLREEHARRLQDSHDALIWKIERDATESPLRTVGYHQLELGLGVLGYPILWERWPRHPFKSKYGKSVPYTKRGRAYPESVWTPEDRKRVAAVQRIRRGPLVFDVHAVHPRRVFFDLHHDPPEDVFIENTVLPGIYLDRYPQLAELSTHSAEASTAKFLIYCSRDEYGLWYNGQPLLTAKEGANAEGFARNRTGILWYRMAQGGFGHQGYGNEWELKIQGIVRGLRPVIITKIIDYNVMGIMRQVYGIPPLGVEAATIAEAIAAARRIVFGMGAVWPHTPGEKQHKLDLPDIPAVLFQEMGESDNMIERHTWSDVLRGANPASETMGGAGQRLSQGQAVLRSAKRNHEQLIEGMLQDMDHMVKYELQEPVELLSQSGEILMLDPDDIVDGMRTIVNSKPATPEEKMAQRREQIVLVDARLRSRYTTLVEDPDVIDPEKEMARILSDAAMESEGIVNAIANEALQQVTGVPASGTTESAAPAVSPLAQGQNGSQSLLAPSEVGAAGAGMPPLRRG